LKAKLGNDPVDSPFADTEVGLSEFLSNDLGGCLWIQETMTDDLANHFLGATIVGFGASFRIDQSLPPLFEEKSSELKVALATEAKLCRDLVYAQRAAFTLDEHGKFSGDFVIIRDGKRSGIALNGLFRNLERDHRVLQGNSLINYGTAV
jgi:hypothetical protein